jgi:hypothetical protein
MSISEIKVGTIVKVKVGRNIVPAKVVEILEDGFRVSSIAKNKEFIVTASRIVVEEEQLVEPEEPVEEFQPSGDDEEDEYVINPAHESDKPVKHLSLLNAAVIVLRETKADMNTRELIEAIVERQLWTPTECKTPEQTLYGSIFREIATKEHPRIVKSEIKGKFRIAE